MTGPGDIFDWMFDDETQRVGDKVMHVFTLDHHVRIVNDGEIVQVDPQDTIAEARAVFDRVQRKQ